MGPKKKKWKLHNAGESSDVRCDVSQTASTSPRHQRKQTCTSSHPHHSPNRSLSNHHVKRKRKRGRTGGASSMQNVQQLAADVSSQGSQQSSDIPGFYYDAQKKKYFRILPGQNNVGSGMITENTIREHQQERIRLNKIEELNCGAKHVLPSVERTKKSKGLQPCVSNTFRSSYSTNIYDMVDSSRLGFLGKKPVRTSSLMSQWTLCHMLSHIKPKVKQRLSSRSNPGWQYSGVEHCLKMYPNKDATQMLCLWSLKDTFAQMVGNIHITSYKQIDEEGTVEGNFDLAGPTYTHYRGQITGLCWAPKSDDQACGRVLFTTTCFLGNSSSLAMLEPLDTEGRAQQEPQVFDLGQGTTTWTCAWEQNAQKFSVGVDKRSLLLDVQTRRVWELHTLNSDVYTQAFIPTTGQQLFSGTKKGHLLCHDIRSKSTRHVYALTHKSPLSHLQPTQDGTCVFSADFSGQLLQWDLRQRKVVLEFQGHNNVYSRVPFHLDQSEDFLCAAGQDNYTHVWDVSTARLLATLPPPHPASRGTIPAVSLLLAHPRARPGLLMATHDELHFYSY